VTMIDFRPLSASDANRAFAGLLVERPIALVTTVDSQGNVSLASVRCFLGIASPPMLVLALEAPQDGPGNVIYRSLMEQGEAVVHVPDREHLESIPNLDGMLASNARDIRRLGLFTESADAVAPPRLAGVPLAMECRLNKEIRVSPSSTLLLLDVLVAHVHNASRRCEPCALS
jgi:flavin reductase (DIM6/NTAB) family NADH-FMN oxidoreductase RutF